MLIVFAGIDGSGKSTQVNLLSQYFISQGKNVFVSKAYTQKEKDLFREYIETADQKTITFLFQAFHVQQYIQAQNALSKDQIVIADRWDESYLAYHSIYGVLANRKDLREELNQITFQNLKPEICFLLDLDPKLSLRRIPRRGKDYFDLSPLSYHIAMSNEYKDLAVTNHWIILDGTLTIEKIHSIVIETLTGLGV